MENLINALKAGKVEVIFTKKNGDLRIMNCTLNDSFLPESIQTDIIRTKKDGLLCVYDTDVSGWRSFNYDQLVSWV